MEIAKLRSTWARVRACVCKAHQKYTAHQKAARGRSSELEKKACFQAAAASQRSLPRWAWTGFEPLKLKGFISSSYLSLNFPPHHSPSSFSMFHLQQVGAYSYI